MYLSGTGPKKFQMWAKECSVNPHQHGSACEFRETPIPFSLVKLVVFPAIPHPYMNRNSSTGWPTVSRNDTVMTPHASRTYFRTYPLSSIAIICRYFSCFWHEDCSLPCVDSWKAHHSHQNLIAIFRPCPNNVKLGLRNPLDVLLERYQYDLITV